MLHHKNFLERPHDNLNAHELRWALWSAWSQSFTYRSKLGEELLENTFTCNNTQIIQFNIASVRRSWTPNVRTGHHRDLRKKYILKKQIQSGIWQVIIFCYILIQLSRSGTLAIGYCGRGYTFARFYLEQSLPGWLHFFRDRLDW